MKYCTNCGKPVDPSASFCENCGSPIEKEPVPAGNGNTAPAEAETDFTEAAAPAPSADFDGDTGKKPKAKKGLIAALAAAALICAGVLAFFLSPVFQNTVMRTFAPKSTYLGYVLKQNTVSSEPLQDIFDSTYDSDIGISVDDKLIDMIGKSAGLDSKTTSILKAVNDADFFTSIRLNDTQFASTATAKLNGTEIGTADISADFEDRIAFLDLNDLNDKALGTDVDDGQAESYLLFGKAYSIIEDNEKDIKKLSTKYTKTALSDIKIEKGSRKIDAGDFTKKYTALSFTLDDETVKSIAEDVLKDAKKDKELKSLLVKFSELDEGTGLSQSDIEEYIDEALEGIENIDFEETVDVVLFVDNDAKIKGMTLNEHESGYEFYYADVNKGYKFATDMSVSAGGEPVLGIKGEGTEKHGKRTGEYTLSLNAGIGGPMDLCKIELDGFSVKDAEGRAALSLTSNAYNMLSLGLDMDRMKDFADLLESGKLVLDINKSKADRFDGSLSLNYGDADLISLNINSKKERGSEIDFPGDYTKSESDWQNSIDIFGVMSRLKGTGIPLADLMP